MLTLYPTVRVYRLCEFDMKSILVRDGNGQPHIPRTFAIVEPMIQIYTNQVIRKLGQAEEGVKH